MSPALPNSTNMGSVPAETSVWELRISNYLRSARGQGTSVTSVMPVMWFWRTFFINPLGWI